MVILGMVVASPAFAAANDVYVNHRNSDDSADEAVTLPDAPDHWRELFGTDGNGNPYEYWLGNGFSYAGHVLGTYIQMPDVDGGQNVDNTHDIDKPVSTAQQAAIDAVASTTSSGLTALSSLQRVRAQANSSGVYTWTFPTAFAGTPVVSATTEDATSNAVVSTRITAISSTSVTVQVTRTVPVTVLGISVLGSLTTPADFVDITAIAQ